MALRFVRGARIEPFPSTPQPAVAMLHRRRQHSVAPASVRYGRLRQRPAYAAATTVPSPLLLQLSMSSRVACCAMVRPVQSASWRRGARRSFGMPRPQRMQSAYLDAGAPTCSALVLSKRRPGSGSSPCAAMERREKRCLATPARNFFTRCSIIASSRAATTRCGSSVLSSVNNAAQTLHGTSAIQTCPRSILESRLALILTLRSASAFASALRDVFRSMRVSRTIAPKVVSLPPALRSAQSRACHDCSSPNPPKKSARAAAVECSAVAGTMVFHRITSQSQGAPIRC